MKFSKFQLDAADEVIKEWRKSGDIDLVNWIDYHRRKLDELKPIPIIKFDVSGNPSQGKAVEAWHDNETSLIVFGHSKGGGGSFLGTSLLLIDALTYPSTMYFIARKTNSDLIKFSMATVRECLNSLGVAEGHVKFNTKDMALLFPNGSIIFLLNTKYTPADPKYARFGNMMFTRGFIDNASEVEPDAIISLMACCGRIKNEEYNIARKMLIKVNPTDPGTYFYENYYRPFRDGLLPTHIKFIQSLPRDNKFLDSGYIDHLEKTLSPSQRRRLLEGDWDSKDE